jgi:hypothetical protein
VHEYPFIFRIGLDLDRIELAERRLELFPAEDMDLNGPVLAAVVNVEDDRCSFLVRR